MKPESRLKEETESRPWLKEKVYDPKRERTVELVNRAVESLLKTNEPISLASLAARSKELDPEGRGISETAILNNEEARRIYQQNRAWRGACRVVRDLTEIEPKAKRPIKMDRDQSRARRRYLRMSKADLAGRLLAAEQKFAENEEQWILVNEELMTWRLRAELAERRLSREPD